MVWDCSILWELSKRKEKEEEEEDQVGNVECQEVEWSTEKAVPEVCHVDDLCTIPASTLQNEGSANILGENTLDLKLLLRFTDSGV